MSYMVPVGRAEQQEYQAMFEDFTCCMGTGMENHALHGEGIYYESPDTVWVNLFVPSTAELQNGIRLTTETDFPDGEEAKITLTGHAARPFTMAIRRPGWAGDDFVLSVNGQRIAVPPVATLRPGGAGGRDLGLDRDTLPPSSYVMLERTWHPGDVIELKLPKTLRLEPTPDDRTVSAIMWGPLVLAADLGPRSEKPEGAPSAIVPPALVVDDRPIADWLRPVDTRPGDFRAAGVAHHLASPNDASGDVALAPFYRTHGRTYSVYFDVLRQQEWNAQVAARAAERERQRRLEAATVAVVHPGQPADEQTFNYRSEPPTRPVVRTGDRTGRGGAGAFSFELPIEASGAQALVVTYHNDLGLPVFASFEIQVDGTVLARYEPNDSATGFWDATYPLPPTVLAGKRKVTIRFAAAPDSRIAPVYGIRITRAPGS